MKSILINLHNSEKEPSNSIILSCFKNTEAIQENMENYYSNELHSTHQKQSSDINSLKLNDSTQTSCPIRISNTLNEYFSSIGVSMENGIRPTNTSFTTFMKSISQSFVLDGTCAEEIIACVTNLKNTSSSGIDGI